MKIFCFILSAACLISTGFFPEIRELDAGFFFFLGLALLFTALSSESSTEEDWRSKYRPG
jgi:hypothetical protein